MINMPNWIDFKSNREITDVADMPEGVFGFVYLIVTYEGKKYIGRKQVSSKRKRRFGKREIAKLKDKRKKTWEWVIKESDWKDYVSSNDKLKEDIANGTKYEKYIIEYAFSKKELSYLEEKHLFSKGVLESDTWYNSNIAGRYFPKDVVKE
jgi:hypothetical protein